MPELPEIEVIRMGLTRKIIGLKIKEIEVLSPKSFIGRTDELEGQKVLKIWRKAKFLGIDLIPSKLRDSSLVTQNDQVVTLLIHLKMSGQLVYEDENRFIGGHPTEDMTGKMPNSHTRVIFTFSDGSHLYFNDQRKFGWIRVISKFEIRSAGGSLKNNSNFLNKLGPEPLEKGFTWDVLKQNLLRHKKMPVKVVIMDQSAISGVGNIYANEACFNARIDPRKKIVDLSDEQFKKLHTGIIKALKAGIEHGGSTRAHFVDAEGHKGYFLDYAFVYGKDKHPCKVCGRKIEKIQLGGRGTYFCPHDQK